MDNFLKLQYILSVKPSYTSVRVRLMIQDILDMRKKSWRGRRARTEKKLKTREELQCKMNQDGRKTEQAPNRSAHADSGTSRDVCRKTYEILLDEIFTKASDDPTLGPHFAKICKGRLQFYVQDNEANGNETENQGKATAEFRNMLLQKYEDENSGYLHKNLDILLRMREIGDIEDPGRKKSIEIDEEKGSVKKRWLGLIRFTGELCVHNLVNSSCSSS